MRNKHLCKKDDSYICQSCDGTKLSEKLRGVCVFCGCKYIAVEYFNVLKVNKIYKFSVEYNAIDFDLDDFVHDYSELYCKRCDNTTSINTIREYINNQRKQFIGEPDED